MSALFSVLLVEIFLLRSLLRTQRFLALPHGFMFYIMIGQCLYYAVASGFVSYDFITLYSSMRFSDNYPSVELLFFAMFLFIWLSSRDIRLRQDPPKRFMLSYNAYLLLICTFYLFAGLHLAVIDKDILWDNDKYLLLTSPDAMVSKNAFTKFLSSAFDPIGVIVVASAGVAHMSGYRRGWALLLPAIVWWFVFELSAHSRTAAFYLFAAAAMAAMASRRRWIPAALTIAGIATLISVLGGRGEDHNGLSDLPNYFANISYALSDNPPLEPLLNLFEGFFSTAELFVFRGDFNEAYKLLSFSPLPSLIDGFAAVRQANEIRLHEYVPMGAIQEIFSFGPGYVVFYLAVAALSLRLNLYAIARQPTLVSTFNNFLIAACWYISLTYPCRLVFKFFYFSIVLDCAAILSAHGKTRLGLARNRSETANPELSGAEMTKRPC